MKKYSARLWACFYARKLKIPIFSNLIHRSKQRYCCRSSFSRCLRWCGCAESAQQMPNLHFCPGLESGLFLLFKVILNSKVSCTDFFVNIRLILTHHALQNKSNCSSSVAVSLSFLCTAATHPWHAHVAFNQPWNLGTQTSMKNIGWNLSNRSLLAPTEISGTIKCVMSNQNSPIGYFCWNTVPKNSNSVHF